MPNDQRSFRSVNLLEQKVLTYFEQYHPEVKQAYFPDSYSPQREIDPDEIVDIVFFG